MLYNAIPESSKKFHCETCLYSCSRKSQYDRHISTTKHQIAIKTLQNAIFSGPKSSAPKPVTKQYYNCMCGKKFSHNSSYYRHRINCYKYQTNINDIDGKSSTSDVEDAFDNSNDIEEQNKSELIDYYNTYNNDNQSGFKELVLLLLKENKEIQKNFVNLLPHIKGNNTNTNSNNTIHNTTTNNNQFNVNMFLNEHCKNAMNLTDFIDTLPLTPETFDNTIENGLTKSITTMITNGLNNMDILERPIHCTDPARKTMYIKDNNVWEKDKELNLLLNGITKVALKQRSNISKWQDANNGWATDDDLQTKMTNLVFNSMTQIEKDDKETNKIIRAISKNTYLSSEIKDQYK